MHYEIKFEDNEQLFIFQEIVGLAQPQEVEQEDEILNLFICHAKYTKIQIKTTPSDATLRLVGAHQQTLLEVDIYDAMFVDCIPNASTPELCAWLLIGALDADIQPGHLDLLMRWAVQLPQRKNEWGALTFEQRVHWLDAVATMTLVQTSSVPDESQDIFVMDGTHVTDYPSFFIALGEAMRGPGGYYGRNLDAVSDCLSGGFGPEAPFTLNWQHSKVAQQALDSNAWKRHAVTRFQFQTLAQFLENWSEKQPLWDVIMDTLETAGVSVNLL